MTEQEFAELFARDLLAANGTTHETIAPVWHGMDHEVGTELVASTSLDDYFREKPYGYGVNERWFWTLTGKRIHVSLNAVSEIAK